MDLDDFFENVDGAVFGLFIVIGAFVALAIRHCTRRRFQRAILQFGDLPSKCGLNGRQVAARLLAVCGLGEVPVKRQGPTNCYHPWKREIRLRPETHDTASLSALASAAHEVGHAQHFAERIWRCRLRFVFWPASWAALAFPSIYAILCIMGVVPYPETWFGPGILAACALAVVLQLPISLPLEGDATRRGKKIARDSGLLHKHEEHGFDRVLSAGWKTHAAAEIQRWIVLVSIALAAAGYLWYETYQNQLLDRILAYEPPADVLAFDRLADELPPHPSLTANPFDASEYVYEPQGWARLLWLIPLAPPLLVIGFIVITFLGKPKKPRAGGKLTTEEMAVLRGDTAGTLNLQGKHDAAIDEYTRAIQLNPQFTMAWYNRGGTYLLTGRLEEALSDFDSAACLAPHFLDAIAARGHTRLLLDQEELGLADLETVLSRDPANDNARTARAEYWFGRGEFERAVAEWTEAIEADPARGNFYRDRGLLYYFHGDYARAVNDQTEAIRLDPSDAIARNNRGAALLKRGDWAKAAADLREALRLNPQLPNSYRHLAWLQATCPDSEFRDGHEAVDNATRALELVDWKQGDWLEALAAAHAEAGNFGEAVRWQQKCLSRSPAESKAELQAQLELYKHGQPFRSVDVREATPAS